MQNSPEALWDIITSRTEAGQMKVQHHLFDMLLSPGYLVAAGSLYYSDM